MRGKIQLDKQKKRAGRGKTEVKKILKRINSDLFYVVTVFEILQI